MLHWSNYYAGRATLYITCPHCGNKDVVELELDKETYFKCEECKLVIPGLNLKMVRVV